MWFFDNKKSERKRKAEQLAKEARATKVLARREYKQELQSAKQVNKKLRTQLEENGFHILLFKAAGGSYNSGSHK